MISFFSDLLVAISERGRSFIDLQDEPSRKKDLLEICNALLSQKGEASGIALASEFFTVYEGLDETELDHFFLVLAKQFGPDIEAVQNIIDDLHDAPTLNAFLDLHKAGEPKRQELFRRLNQAPEGTLKLVRLRQDLLERLEGNPQLAEINVDLLHLFQSWFNRGFLILKRVTWSTSASVLEKIIKYETVHEIGSWEELRRRIEPADRRCYAFFHPALLDEPLIFVEVALTDKVPDAIEPVIMEKRAIIAAQDAKIATFYSISNCQKGLAGISFGSFLIKQVANDLIKELPFIRSFVTLSPVPGFMKWLHILIDGQADVGPDLGAQDIEKLSELSTSDWSDNSEKQQALKEIVEPLCAWYFLHAKGPHNKLLDAVARFHLGNGARLERINWLADRSAKSLDQSAGIMVNYLYDLDKIEHNHEAFANDGTVIAASSIARIAKQSSSFQTVEEVS